MPIPTPVERGARQQRAMLQLLLRHALIGHAVGFILAAGLYGFNVLHLKEMTDAADLGWLAVVLLGFFFGLTFSSVQMGIAIMGLGKSQSPPD